MGLTGTKRLAGLLLLLVCAACSSTLPAVEPATPVLPESTQASASAAGSAAAPTVIPVEQATAIPDAPLAALVDGRPLYLADYERELGQYEASLVARGIDPTSAEGQDNLAQARGWILNVLIEQILTEQAAADAGINVSDAEVDAYMQEMIAESGGEEAFQATLDEWGESYDDAWQEVRVQLIGMAMTQRIVESVPATAEHVHARHIQVDTREEAERILAQLQAGADFVTLAEAYSQDANTREFGGDLGFFPRGILVAPELEEAAFSLQPGQINNVVTSVLGFHIVQVVERDPARPVSPESLRLLQERALQEWVEGLWAQADGQRLVETNP